MHQLWVANEFDNSFFFELCSLNLKDAFFTQKCSITHTWHPRSPSPKMRSPSVTTITWIDFSGQFFNTSRILPLQKLNHLASDEDLKLWFHNLNQFLCEGNVQLSCRIEQVRKEEVGVLLFQADVKTLWTSVNATVLLAGLTNCRSIDYREQFFNIIDKKLVEQLFIPLLVVWDAK